MEDERFKGVVVWYKEYKINSAFLEWVKEHDPEWYKELEPVLKVMLTGKK